MKSIGLVVGSRLHTSSIVFLDIDDYSKRDVRKEIYRLMDKWKLGNCVLTQTGEKNWHSTFFWNMMRWEKSVEIMEDCKLIDQEFKMFRKSVGFTRIRVGLKNNIKPKIIEVIESPHHIEDENGQFYYTQYKMALMHL